MKSPPQIHLPQILPRALLAKWVYVEIHDKHACLWEPLFPDSGVGFTWLSLQDLLWGECGGTCLQPQHSGPLIQHAEDRNRQISPSIRGQPGKFQASKDSKTLPQRNNNTTPKNCFKHWVSISLPILPDGCCLRVKSGLHVYGSMNRTPMGRTSDRKGKLAVVCFPGFLWLPGNWEFALLHGYGARPPKTSERRC